MEFENIIDIQRPVDAVFDFVTRFENLPKWNYYVLNVQKETPEPLGEGVVFHQERQSDAQDFRVVEYVENERVTVKTTPASKPRFKRRFLFEEVDGATRMVDTWLMLELDVNPVVAWLGKNRVRAAVAENLTKLKQLLETGKTRLQDGRTVVL
jgi:uncharacterized membrane protein